jgi:large subunit ribosomal protein L25
MSSNLKIIERSAAGKREARKLRHNGFVPGIIYGDNKEPMKVAIGGKELTAECYSLSFLGHVIDVKFGSSSEQIIPRSIDFDPVTDKPIHIDFQRISKNSKIKIHIPIEVENELKCPGIKKGGIVNFVVHQLECTCSPDSIPEKIVLDLSGKDIGESLLLESVVLPKGASAANPERDAVLATIVAARLTSDDAVASSSASENSEGTNS